MKGKRFYIADVFAEKPHTGNQLAVFLDSGELSTETMQTLAREMNFAESTFVRGTSERDGGWDVRIFTPARELPFAGHPTLGTAQVLRDVVLGEPREEIRLNLGVGRIPVRFGPGPDGAVRGFMRQRSPEFGPTVPHETVARVLGVEPADLDERFPSQRVSTGLPFLLVPLRQREAVRRARLDGRLYDAFVGEHDLPAIFFFCPEPCSPENHFHARMFAEGLGVVEDPATGSANGCLAGYLSKYRYLGGSDVDVRVEQGYAIGRPSLLFLRAREESGSIVVEVGGRVFVVARGEWLADAGD